jgi:hypothetical protein
VALRDDAGTAKLVAEREEKLVAEREEQHLPGGDTVERRHVWCLARDVASEAASHV